MRFTGISGLLLILLSPNYGLVDRKEPMDFLWYPNGDGSGVVPAILEDPPEAEKFSTLWTTDTKHIRFYLYTLANPKIPDKVSNSTSSIQKSHWDLNAPVKIFSHGFASSPNIGFSKDVKRAFLSAKDLKNVNIIIVDWKRLAAAPFYSIAAKNTKIVGKTIAHFVDFLLNEGFTTLDKVGLIGHSLGAHVSGYAGFTFQKLRPGHKLPRITGLDAAYPLFGSVSDDERIDPTDADFVDVIHTATGRLLVGRLGFEEPRGHVDFYPNGGKSQPGCGYMKDPFGICSHHRCYKYFAESVNLDAYTACKCADDAWDPKSKDKFKSCSCMKGIANMGAWTSSKAKGIYHLRTNPRPPYAAAF